MFSIMTMKQNSSLVFHVSFISFVRININNAILPSWENYVILVISNEYIQFYSRYTWTCIWCSYHCSILFCHYHYDYLMTSIRKLDPCISARLNGVPDILTLPLHPCSICFLTQCQFSEYLDYYMHTIYYRLEHSMLSKQPN